MSLFGRMKSDHAQNAQIDRLEHLSKQLGALSELTYIRREIEKSVRLVNSLTYYDEFRKDAFKEGWSDAFRNVIALIDRRIDATQSLASKPSEQ